MLCIAGQWLDQMAEIFCAYSGVAGACYRQKNGFFLFFKKNSKYLKKISTMYFGILTSNNFRILHLGTHNCEIVLYILNFLSYDLK